MALIARLGTWLTEIAVRPPVSGRRRTAVLAAAAFGIALIAWIDLVTGGDVASVILYLLPVLAVTLLAGTEPGMVVALTCAVMWTSLQVSSDQLDHPMILVWNALTITGVFEFDVLLLAFLRAALVKARDSDRRSRQFLADAAHQLRTPLTGVRVTAEALLRGPEAGEAERLLSNLARESGRTGQLLSALLRLARLDQSEALLPAPCHVAEIAATEAERVGGIDQIAVSTSVTLPEPGLALLDERAIREAVANLLDNARRHARSAVSLSVALDGRELVIRVCDDGPGLSPAIAAQAFARFVSFGPHNGSGLGLPIARGLARAHGGDLYFDGIGFVIRLPYRRPPVGPGSGLLATVGSAAARAESRRPLQPDPAPDKTGPSLR